MLKRADMMDAFQHYTHDSSITDATRLEAIATRVEAIANIG